MCELLFYFDLEFSVLLVALVLRPLITRFKQDELDNSSGPVLVHFLFVTLAFSWLTNIDYHL